jgi:hypothetical protein
MSDDRRARSARSVFEDHLRLAGDHRWDEDIDRNFAADCVVLARSGPLHGHDGLRELVKSLEEDLPGAPYTYTTQLVEGRLAFLEWTAETENARVRDGADSFLVEDGLIVAQTIHYTVEPK